MKDLGVRCKVVTVLLALTTMLGCSSLNAGQPTAQLGHGLVPTDTSLDFGTVVVGNTAVLTNTIVNNTHSPIVLTRTQIDKSEFRITGQKLPLRLAPGERTALQIVFSPKTSGDSEGRVVLTSNVIRPSSTFTLRGTAITSGRISLNPPSMHFGNVAVGKTQTQSATLSNSGKSDINITHATISGRGFALTGVSSPLILKAGQSETLHVSFTPVTGGPATGAISLIGTLSLPAWRRPGRHGRLTDVALTRLATTLNAPISGTGIGTALGAGQLAVTPSTLALGHVRIGTSQTQAATLTNSGGSSITISQATVTGRGFRLSGLGFPLTLSPGQSKTFGVTFAPQSAGSASGSVAITSNAPNSVVSVPVSAMAIAAGALISNPASLNFGAVQAGQRQTLPETITNSGVSSVTVSRVNISNPGFAISGLNLPAALGPGQSTTFTVTFTPRPGGSASGILSVMSDSSNPALTIPLAAGTATAGVLNPSDSSLDFSNVRVGGNATQSETLTNSGDSSVTISQVDVTGAGFRITGLSLPLTLSPRQSFTFGAVFAPTSGGSVTGSISVVSDASDSTLKISLAGTATVSGQLAVSPATLNFGNVVVGQTKSLTGTLTAGSSGITVTNASMSTSEFTISGLAFPLTLAAGQSKSFTLTFKPQASGTAAASGSFISNASNSSVVQSLTGSGTAAPQHSVALSWNASSSNVVGYNVYRGAQTGGPYSQINALNADTNYVDSSVQAGQTYFYVTTAVDGAGRESTHSNQIQAVVPNP